MDTLGDRIKEVRKHAKETQVDFGKLIGVSGAAISQIESNNSQPTEAAIKLICATYNVDYRWLTTGQGEMFLPMDTDALVDKYLAGESELTKAIMKAFAKLPDDECDKWFEMLKCIKKEGV